MTVWQERPPERRDEREPERDEREPDMSDPEAQHAPGDDPTGVGSPGEAPPPMQAGTGAIGLDASGAGDG